MRRQRRRHVGLSRSATDRRLDLVPAPGSPSLLGVIELVRRYPTEEYIVFNPRYANSLKFASTVQRLSRLLDLTANCPRVAQRKLEMIHTATRIEDLKALPGNRRETLKGDRAGQHSIRINEQWCICFVWENEAGNARDVEIVDYH